MPLTMNQHKTLRGAARRHSSTQPLPHRGWITPQDTTELTRHNTRMNDLCNALAALLIIAIIGGAFWLVNDVPPEQRITSSEAARR